MLFTAEELQRWRWRAGGAPGVKAPQAVILCLQPDVLRRARGRYPVKPVRGFFGDCFVLKNTQGRVALAGGFGLGSPVMAILVEEFAAFGVRRILSIGVAGSLQPGLYPGDVIVCDKAYRDEGTSQHYLPPSPTVEADPGMAQGICATLDSHGMQTYRGASWTTDAPYRETLQKADQYRKEGVLGVEMETAALFAAARVLGVRAAAVLVTADRLLPHGWEPPQKLDWIRKSQDKVLDVAIHWLESNDSIPGEA
jgi:uridine phosphorylase